MKGPVGPAKLNGIYVHMLLQRIAQGHAKPDGLCSVLRHSRHLLAINHSPAVNIINISRLEPTQLPAECFDQGKEVGAVWMC